MMSAGGDGAACANGLCASLPRLPAPVGEPLADRAAAAACWGVGGCAKSAAAAAAAFELLPVETKTL